MPLVRVKLSFHLTTVWGFERPGIGIE
jgi:hypothetical protein